MMNLWSLLLSALVLLTDQVTDSLEIHEQTKLPLALALYYELGGRGPSVAGHHNVLVAGLDGQFVRVFRKNGTNWIEEAEWMVDMGGMGGGPSVAIYEDTLVLGMQKSGYPGSSYDGAAIVFSYNGTYWNEVTRLTPSEGVFKAAFGWSVAMDQATIVVGAPGSEYTTAASYIFVRDGGTWTEQAKLQLSVAEDVDRFGWSVAVDQGTVMVGVPCFSQDGDPAGSGSAHIYSWNDAGARWIEEARLVGDPYRFFGLSVGLHGVTAVVGSPGCRRTYSEPSVRGSASVFHLDGTNWTKHATLIPSEGATGDRFGYSVAVQQDTVVIGSPKKNGFRASQGSAFVFVTDGTEWTESAQLISSDGAYFESLGISVAIDSDNVFATTGFDPSVYVFELDFSPPLSTEAQ